MQRFGRLAGAVRRAAAAAAPAVAGATRVASARFAGVAATQAPNASAAAARSFGTYATASAAPAAGGKWSALLRMAVGAVGVPVAAAAVFYSVNGEQFVVVAAAEPIPSNSKVVITLPDGTQVVVTGPGGGAKAGLKKHVVIFECEGGSDKGPDGHRKDSMPIINELTKLGWTGEIVFYDDAKIAEIKKHVASTADAFISRVNPGKYPTYTESKYHAMLRELYDEGVVAMPHPDAMISYGAKDALVKLAQTPAGLPDTYAYYDLGSIKKIFPTTIANHIRVLKQNRGSTGEGIWVVKPYGWEHGKGVKITKDTLIECIEMVDNHKEIRKLGEFMDFCEQYVVGEGGQLVDQRFLPRIVEGEIRVFMIYDKPINVVHKKPAEGEYSATLFSGAKYQYDPPSKWPELVGYWLNAMPDARKVLGDYDYPLIWTADFILDTNPDGTDAYRLGEMNCSCVGFTSELELAKDVAEAVVRIVSEKKA